MKKKMLKPSEENTQVINEYLKFRESLKKSKWTVRREQYVLDKLSDFLGDKNLKDATDKDLQSFFTDVNENVYNMFGMTLRTFYRWTNNITDKEIPENLKWFKQKSRKKIQRHRDPDKKRFLVTDIEYQTIQNYCKSRHGMWNAFYECLWLSGARLEELQSMKIKDVIIENGNVKLKLNTSKSETRIVPLCEKPNLLIRWMENHPDKNNPDSYLFVNTGKKNYCKKISRGKITAKILELRRETNIKDTITTHCFRKSRATKMINSRTKDGGLKYTTKQIAQFFGWGIQRATEMMEIYDLNGQEELEKLVFSGDSNKLETYDIVKQQKEELENQYKEQMDKMQEQMRQMQEQLMKITGGELQQRIEEQREYEENKDREEDQLLKESSETFGTPPQIL